MEQAREAYFLDFYAPSTRPSVAAKLRTVQRALANFGQSLEPPSVDKIHSLGMILKAGRYRSAAGYFHTYKVEMERRGHVFDGTMVRAIKDGTRSCLRGLGGPVRALPLPFERLRDLPGGDGPWVAQGPLFPRNLLVVGSWFMLREIEASTLTVQDVEVIESEVLGVPRVSCSLPASKTDQRALGVTRTHGCLCRVRPDALCPAHAAWDQRRRLIRRFGTEKVHGCFPFFPTVEGRVCGKEAVAETFVAAARHLQVPVESPDGAERVSGHTLRVTGAQGMARAGLDIWAIQLLGRWGSDAVNTYVRDAQLASAASWASRAASTRSLSEVVDDIVVRRRPVEDCGLAVRPMRQQGAVAVDVAEALDHEVAAAVSSTMVQPKLVQSSTGVWHAVLLQPEVADPGLAVTFCGWRFGHRQYTIHEYSELPASHKVLCAKCLPAKRAERKQDVERIARSVE